jgi:hypothetical protein
MFHSRHAPVHCDPLNHPEIPRIRNVNDLAEVFITLGIYILVNDQEGDAAGCTGQCNS